MYRTFNNWTLEKVTEYFGEMEHGSYEGFNEKEVKTIKALWDDIQGYMDITA